MGEVGGLQRVSPGTLGIPIDCLGGCELSHGVFVSEHIVATMQASWQHIFETVCRGTVAAIPPQLCRANVDVSLSHAYAMRELLVIVAADAIKNSHSIRLNLSRA